MTNAITIAKVIGNLSAAWLLVKMGPKKAFSLALLLIVAGVAGAYESSYPWYVFTRLVMGFGGALIPSTKTRHCTKQCSLVQMLQG
ncbi:hypothetical protein [Agarivorans sp. QJM3NY_25]|uniref:hypothetical protein n=1 Tax=Agarivorans sp. QJM3NY_25 TaxID=3421430 RepID=UPI003D7E945C